MVLDKAQGDELTLFIENDGNLYRQITTPIINNYARKKLKGTFTRALALKGILQLVEAGRRGYIRAFGSIGGTVSMDTKMYVAKQLFSSIDEQSTFEAKRLRKQMSAGRKLKKGLKKR